MRKERTNSKLCSELSANALVCAHTRMNRCDFKMFLRRRCVGGDTEEPGASLDWCVGINVLENVRLRGSGIVH